MSDEIKTEEKTERNLIADLSGDIMSSALLESNPIYAKYMPYYARRQFFKGQRDEPLTDVDINSEYSTLGAYGQRKQCSVHHYTRLLNYTSEAEELMAARNKIIKYYFCNAVWDKTYCDCMRLADYQRKIGKENLVNILTAFIGIGKPDNALMLAFSQMLLFSTREAFVQEYGTDFVDRVLIYIFLHGPMVSVDDTKNNGFYLQFGDDIARLVSVWGDTTMKVDIGKIEFNYIAKYGAGMLARAQRLFEHPWFNSIVKVNDFIQSHSDQYSDEEVSDFLSRKSNLHTFSPEKIEMCGNGKYKHITTLHYLMSDIEYWPRHWNRISSEENKHKFISGAICSTGNTRACDPMLDGIIEEVLGYLVSAFIEKYPVAGNDDGNMKPDNVAIMHIDAIFILFRRCAGRMIRVAKGHIVNLVKSTRFPDVIINKTLELNRRMRHKKYEFTNEELESFLAIADVRTVIGCANIGSNLEFLKAHMGELFVELPYSVLTNNFNSLCTDQSLDWVWDNITKEQRKFFPFPISYMRKNQEKFAEYMSNANTDRFIAAYGVNWVEQIGEVSVTDLVKSGSIFVLDYDVAKRYLDIIMLDDELRFIFLEYHANGRDTWYLNDAVLESSTFSNAIKCEFLAAKYKLNVGKLNEDEVREGCAYIVGSGLSGYKFLYTLLSKDITPELKKYIRQIAGYIDSK